MGPNEKCARRCLLNREASQERQLLAMTGLTLFATPAHERTDHPVCRAACLCLSTPRRKTGPPHWALAQGGHGPAGAKGRVGSKGCALTREDGKTEAGAGTPTKAACRTNTRPHRPLPTENSAVPSGIWPRCLREPRAVQTTGATHKVGWLPQGCAEASLVGRPKQLSRASRQCQPAQTAEPWGTHSAEKPGHVHGRQLLMLLRGSQPPCVG